METHLPTPTTARVYVNLPEGGGFNHLEKYSSVGFTIPNIWKN
jgi:hypothetical protein